MKKVLSEIIVCLLLASCSNNSSISLFNPVLRAKRYLNKSLKEYRVAIKKHPGDKKLIEEYTGILKSVKGDVPSKVEFAILLSEMGLKDESEKVLMDALITNRDETERYLASRINEAMPISERILLYEIALKGFPNNGNYWYQLGRLYLGTNNIQAGIQALENAYFNGMREHDLFYYLTQALLQTGEYTKAEGYLNEGIRIAGETVELSRLRYTLYVKQKKTELAKAEQEKIKKMAKKEEVEKEKPSIVLPEIGPYKFLYVSKNKQQLYVYNVEKTGLKVLDTVPCTTGKNKGPKMEKGDARTPEGAYLIISKMDGPSLPPKYGIVAYPLNYPDVIDRRLGKDGDGIWLHGTPIERPPYNSEGCVVVGDNDLKKLMDYITVRKTFVCIGEEPLKVDYRAMEKALETVKQWKDGWESLDIERYIAVYDEMFYSGGRDKKQYKEYKKKINKNKQSIKVEISEIQILPYGNTPLGNMQLAFFKQRYSSNNFSSSGYKFLYLVERNGKWFIIGEEML